MTLKKFALKYERCSLEELQTFCKDRGIKLPSNTPKRKLQTKKFFREKLELADENATFPFLDLIPELRTLVYRELLTLSPVRLKWKPVCWPQILRASKEVNTGAESILYHYNVFELKIYQTPSGLRYPTFALYGAGYDQLSLWSDTLRRVFIHWKEHLHRIRHLKLTVDLKVNREDDDSSLSLPADSAKLKGVNHLLYSLCSYLSTDNVLEKFELHLSMKDEDHDQLDRGLLWPLTKFHNADILHIEGIPDDARSKLLDQVRSSSTLQANCIGEAVKMLDRADKLRSLAESVSYASHKETIAGATHPINVILRTDDYINEKNDEWLQNCNAELKKFLDGHIPIMLINAGHRKMLVLDGLLDDLC